jgi:hypothetical protein
MLPIQMFFKAQMFGLLLSSITAVDLLDILCPVWPHLLADDCLGMFQYVK